MVKLIRLTSEDDNKFNANMDSDIVVGERAQLGLKNVTFETIFNLLSVGGNDETVSFNFNTTQFSTTREGKLKNKTYTSADFPEFFDDLAGAFNDCCFVNLDPSAVNSEPFANYMQLSVVDDDDKRELSQRVTPMLHPLLKTRAFNYFYEASEVNSGYEPSKLFFDATPALYDTYGSIVSPAPADTTDGVWVIDTTPSPAPAEMNPLDYGVVAREVGTSSADLDRYIYPNASVEWSKGSSVWWCRVHKLTDNGGASDTNGFALGLSYTKLDGTDTAIPTAARDFEIRCEKPDDTIKIIDPTTANTLTDSGVATHSVTATTPADNDIMMLRKDGDNIRGYYITGKTGYSVLPEGNNWTQAPGGQTEVFDEINLGGIATYRRTQVGASPAFEQWYEAVDATNWNIYNTKPVAGQAADNTATINQATGVITIVGGGAPGTTFTPSSIPSIKTSGERRKILEYTIPVADRQKAIYPYLYVCGEQAHAQIGQPSMTLDPFAIDNLDGTHRSDAYLASLTPQAGDLYGYNFDGALPEFEIVSGYERSNTTIQAVLPSLDQDYYESGGKAGQVTSVNINKEILRFMGFTSPKYLGTGDFEFNPEWNKGDNAGTYGFAIVPDGIFQVNNSDNYVVVIDSLPVLSYDASLTQGALANSNKAAKTGRRLNIIATIPINNNNGIVEFDANEVVYIDLDNSFKQNISNMRLRVLDKNLDEVKTQGISVMTLLLKDNDK